MKRHILKINRLWPVTELHNWHEVTKCMLRFYDDVDAGYHRHHKVKGVYHGHPDNRLDSVISTGHTNSLNFAISHWHYYASNTSSTSFSWAPSSVLGQFEKCCGVRTDCDTSNTLCRNTPHLSVIKTMNSPTVRDTGINLCHSWTSTTALPLICALPKRCAHTHSHFTLMSHVSQSVLQSVPSHRNCIARTAPWNYVSVRWKAAPRYPPLIESEIVESYMRGDGPGGQAVAKTSNAVQLLHKPTGIVVKCHETRSLIINRKKCQRRLQEALDWHYNGEQSYIATQRRESAKKKQKKKSRTRKKYEKLKEEKLKASAQQKEQEERELEEEEREIETLREQEQQKSDTKFQDSTKEKVTDCSQK